MAEQSKCSRCGQATPQNALYCRSCGATLTEHPLKGRPLMAHLCVGLWSLLATMVLVQNPLAAGAQKPCGEVMLDRIGRGAESVVARAEELARRVDSFVRQEPTES